MISGQFYLPGYGRVGLSKHPDIKFHIAAEYIFYPVILKVKLQADVFHTVILCRKGNFACQAIRHCLRQHLRVIAGGIQRSKILRKIDLPLRPVSIRIDTAAQVVELQLGAIADIDTGDLHRCVQQQVRYQYYGYQNEKVSPFIPPASWICLVIWSAQWSSWRFTDRMENRSRIKASISTAAKINTIVQK